MIMVPAAIQFKHGMAGIEMVPDDQAGGLKLGQYAVHRRNPHLFVAVEQGLVNVFRAHMLLIGFLEDLEDPDPGQGGLEPRSFQILCLQFGLRDVPGCANCTVVSVDGNLKSITDRRSIVVARQMSFYLLCATIRPLRTCTKP